MNTVQILVTEPAYFCSIMPALKRLGRVVLGRPDRRTLMRLLPRTDIALIRVETQLDRDLLARAPRLKLIASGTTGLNHIDTEYARRRSIRIVNLHGTHTRPTAEHALALMLALARRIPQAAEQMRSGGWNRIACVGILLEGKTLGIVGLGRIGRTVAKLAKGLGMTVIYYDPYVTSKVARRMARLDDLLRRSDIVSIHATLTDETRGMIGARQLARMKRGTMLINTARGEIVRTPALLASLRSGRIGGAALDVYAREPLLANDALRAYARKNPRLILTPHIAATTHESVNACAREMLSAIRTFIR